MSTLTDTLVPYTTLVRTVEAEEADGRGHRQLEEVAGADEGRGCGHTVRLSRRPVQQVGEARVEVDLDEDRHRQQEDDERLGQDLLALEAEQQHQGGQQGDQRSEEHTSELQSLMRISYAVFCL